jgi:hypothetical protein
MEEEISETVMPVMERYVVCSTTACTSDLVQVNDARKQLYIIMHKSPGFKKHLDIRESRNRDQTSSGDAPWECP